MAALQNLRYYSQMHMSRALRVFGITVFLLSVSITSNALSAPESPVHWAADPPPGPIKPGDSIEIHVKAAIDPTWHLYSVTTPSGGPNPTRFSLISGGPFQLAGSIRQSQPVVKFDEGFGIDTEFFSESASFWIPLKASPVAQSGTYDVSLQAVYQVCDDRICLPPTKVPISLQIMIGTDANTPAISGRAKSPEGVTSAGEQPAKGTNAEVQKARSAGFLPFLWLSMTMGLLSLATPCVFPMIPITVSFFTKYAENEKGSGIIHAAIYCFGIIFTFTGLGLGLAAFLGSTGINQFAANPWINLLITAIFVGFAINLFGFFEIRVPSSILTKLSVASGGKGYWPALLMGLTFTLTSFTCTVPFVGTVLVATSQGDWLWPAMGMLGFSVVFAVPFFVLSLLPRMLKRLPRSGGWMNSVKVTMGFLEIAAAMKFISNADLVWNWHIFSHEVVLAVWLCISLLAAIYLLGLFRMPHEGPVKRLGILRPIFAAVFVAIGIYLFTGLMGGSLGELDAFLPPRTAGATTYTGTKSSGRELSWKTDLNLALEEAKQQQRPIFVDFTGYTCTNCRWMEANIFPLPAIHSGLEKFVRLQLFTDGEGKQFEENQKYQKDRFGTVALPFYAILDPQGNALATFPGMTRKPDEFLQFLNSISLR
jgi:thiol:disulfide interchange protein